MAAGSGSSGVLGSFFGGGSDSSATQQDAYRPADHELAKDAVARGQILALSTVIAQLERIAPGRRLSVALRRRGAGWAYDFSVLATNGVVRRVVIDARSNKILELRDVP